MKEKFRGDVLYERLLLKKKKKIHLTFRIKTL